MNNKSIRLFPRILSLILVFLMYVSIFPVPVSTKAADTSSDRVIVGLGDSFSSGEGIEPFYDQDLPIEQKIKSQDWLAHRSTKAWSGLLTLNDDDSGICYQMNLSKYDKNEPNEEAHWYFAATSGAETINLYSEQIKNYYLKSGNKIYNDSEKITEQLKIFEEVKNNNQKADYVTLTLGGNDVGFTQVITSIAKTSFYVTPYDTTELIMEKLQMLEMATVNSLEIAYKKIHEAAGEQATIIVAGYPHLFCPTINTHSSNMTGIMFSLPERIIVNSCVDILNNEIQFIIDDLQKENIDIHYVSVVEEFDGHGAYSLNPYINPIDITPESQDLDYRFKNDDGINPSAYSMHPNDKGAEAYARCVQAKIDELEKRDSSGNSSPIVPIETTKPNSLNNNSNQSGSAAPNQSNNSSSTRPQAEADANWQSAAFDLICRAPEFGLELSDTTMSVELIDATEDGIPEIFFGTYIGATGIPSITDYFYFNGSKYVKGSIEGIEGTYPIEPHTNSDGDVVLLTTGKGDNDFPENMPDYTSYWYSGITVSELYCSGSNAAFALIADFSEYRNDLSGFYSEDEAEIQWAQERWEEFRKEATQFNMNHPIVMYYNYVVSEPVYLDTCSTEGYKAEFSPSVAQSLVDQYANYY